MQKKINEMTFTEKIHWFGRLDIFKWNNICPQCLRINLFRNKNLPQNICHRCGFRRDI